MNRNEYIRRVLPFLSSFSEQTADKVMETIAQYLVDAGEENEQAALEALGSPEALGMKIAEKGESFSIKPFEKPKQPETQHLDNNTSEEITQEKTNEKAQAVDISEDSHSSASQTKQSKKKDVKKMALILGVLVVTSPIWGILTLIFLALGLILALLVASVLLLMSVGGVTCVIVGFTKLFSILPIGLVLTGAGFLLLGIAGIAFFPLLRGSIRLICEVFYDIRDFVERIFRLADSAEVEV